MVVVLSLFFRLCIVIYEEVKFAKLEIATEDASLWELPVPNLEPLAGQSNNMSCPNAKSYITGVFKPPERGEDSSIPQAIFGIDMLTIFISRTCRIGEILAALDNLGQLSESLGHPTWTHSTATFISLVKHLEFTSAGSSPASPLMSCLQSTDFPAR